LGRELKLFLIQKPPDVSSLFTTRGAESGLATVGDFDALRTGRADKVMITEKRCPAYEKFQNVNNNAESDKIAMHQKQFQPVPVVQEDSPELYAVTADVFHVYHLYFTQTINSKKKNRWGFVF